MASNSTDSSGSEKKKAGGIRSRAAVVHETNAPLVVEEITVRDPGPGEVRVRVAACGICASDLHVWRTGEGLAFPAVLGHEASGIVEAVGPEVTAVCEGQRVVVAWVPRCGRCGACRSGRVHLCAAVRTDGSDGSLVLGDQSLGRYMSVSGLAEHIVVSERAAIPLVDGVDLETACTIGCGVTTGYGAASITGGVRSGEQVAVFGCGCVGLSAIQAARIAGARKIFAVDPNRERLALAAEMGATHRVTPDDGNPVKKIQTESDGGVDLAIEAVGGGAIVRQAFDSVAPGGRAISVGLTRFDEQVEIPLVSLLLDKSLRGSIHGSADPIVEFPKLFGLVEQGELELDKLVGPDFPLEKVNDAFEALESGRAIRPRVIF